MFIEELWQYWINIDAPQDKLLKRDTYLYLPDPGVSGIRSMGLGVSNSKTFGWDFADWWYQFNTIDDANMNPTLTASWISNEI